MENYDNTIFLYNEDGEEIEFSIVDRIEYKGDEYLVLWDAYNNDVAVVVDKNGKYEVVDDDEVLDYAKSSFAKSMSNLMSEIDSISDNLDDLDRFFSSTLEDTTDLFDEDTSISESSITSVKFDYNKYILQSQDYLFKEALSKYNTYNYEEAMSLFISAHEDGNIYAAAHIGIMYHYGEGCEEDNQKAFEYFEKGYKVGCPLAAAWYSECYRMGYGVIKNKDYAAKLFNANVDALKELCSAEDVSALYFLGFNLVMGVGCEINQVEGVRLLETAVFKGDTRSAVQLAECYINGWGVTKNINKAIELLMTFPAPKNRKYNFLLGKAYYYGDGVEKDYTKAFFYFEQASTLGLGSAKEYLADCYFNGHGVKKDLYEAARWYKDAADNNGIANAAHSLAFMYMNGEGVPKDETQAINYFMMAAEGGIIQAQRIISQEYVSGNILDRDYEAARVWMEKAANNGDEHAQIMLGRYYISDFGYYNAQKAFECFEKAAEQGNSEAEYTLGKCYIHEIHVKKNLVIANQWFEKAAQKEHPEAMYELGVSYIEGRGISKNIEKGIQYLKDAAEKNSVKACELLAQLYKSGIENYNEQTNYTSLLDAQIYAKKFVELTDDAEAQYLLASILQELENFAEAKTWYQNAVNNGSESAKLALSKMYILEATNYPDAVSMLETISSNKSGEAQYLLAYCLENGYGCEKDKKLAKTLYKSAQINGYTKNPLPRKKKFGLF